MRKKIVTVLIVSMALSLSTPIENFKVNAETGGESSCSEENLSYDDLKSELKEEAQNFIDSSTASIEYSVCEGNNVLISDAVGMHNRSTNKPATNESMYGIGSISKIYTTASIMKLADEGKIDLDLPVTQYVTDFKMKDERYKKITVRMLINHSAGFLVTTQGNVSLREENDRTGFDRFLKDLSEENLKSDPGEVSAYSNDCFTLAQIVVERVSGMKFNEFIENTFTRPLGLTNIKTPLDDFDRDRLARSYSKNTGAERLTESFIEVGMGGMYSTTEDNCKFINAITNENAGVLSKKSIEAMKQSEYLKGIWPTDADNNVVAFGLGWDTVNLFPFNRYGITALGKIGETLDYTSYVISIPQYNISVTVASSNGAFINNERLAVDCAFGVLKKKGIVGQALPELKFNSEKSQSMPENLIDFKGTYFTQYGYYNVDINKDGTLSYYDYECNNIITLHHTYSGYFVSDDGYTAIRFVKEKNGKTYMERRTYGPASGFYQFCSYEYMAQKVEENVLSSEVQKAWKERANKLYFVADEVPSSEFYEYGLGLWIGENVMGYINGSRIVSENESKAEVKLSGFNGCEGYAYNFYKEDGIEYVKHGGIVYMSQDGVNLLSNEVKSVTIGDNGYTKWYYIPEEFDGKVLSSSIPDKSNIVVFDSNGTCQYNFNNYKQDHASLQKGGYVAFVGQKGTSFNFEIQ